MLKLCSKITRWLFHFFCFYYWYVECLSLFSLWNLIFWKLPSASFCFKYLSPIICHDFLLLSVDNFSTFCFCIQSWISDINFFVDSIKAQVLFNLNRPRFERWLFGNDFLLPRSKTIYDICTLSSWNYISETGNPSRKNLW